MFSQHYFALPKLALGGVDGICVNTPQMCPARGGGGSNIMYWFCAFVHICVVALYLGCRHGIL